MNPNQKKLQQQSHQQADEHQLQHSAQQSAAIEFANAEEVIRHDSAQTTVPPEVEARLKNSLAQDPALKRPWWRRLFS